MTDITASDVSQGGHDANAAHDHDKAHPTDKIFVTTAIILAVVTAIEVAWSSLPWGEATGAMAGLEVGGLLVMMAYKFFVVANVFMHLKFDKRLLTGVFFFGLVVAIAVYLGVLAAFEFWFFNQTPEGFCPTNLNPSELSVCEPIVTS